MGNITFLFLAWTAKTRSPITVLLILHFVSNPESESEPESESNRSPESEPESEYPHHDSASLLQIHNQIHTKDANFGSRSSTLGQNSTRKCLFTGPDYRLTSHAGLKERGCETMNIVVGFRVVPEQ